MSSLVLGVEPLGASVEACQAWSRVQLIGSDEEKGKGGKQENTEREQEKTQERTSLQQPLGPYPQKQNMSNYSIVTVVKPRPVS